MVVKEIILKKRRDFNIVLCLTGVIPMLVLVYLLVAKIASIEIFVGEIGYIMFCTIVIFLLGALVGKRMLRSVLKELIEEHRLAAVTETALALSHEINNPLLAVRGNLELLENDFAESQIPEDIKNRLNVIIINCERIRQATEKLTSLSKAASETIDGSAKMIDLGKSN